MSQVWSSETLTRPMRHLFFYYLAFSITLVLVHVGLVSLVAFFHFLLDHEMGVVENWLSRNAWEILCLAKFFILLLMIKTVRLNQYSVTGLISYIRKMNFKPNFQVVVLVLFIWICDLTLVSIGKVPMRKDLQFGPLFLSYIGNALFYLIDAIYISYLGQVFVLKRKRNMLLMGLSFCALFIITTTMLHPYSTTYMLYIILFFLCQMLMVWVLPGNIGNLLFISFAYIGASSVVFGRDLAWGTDFSLFKEMNPFISIGHLFCWGAAVLYLVLSVRKQQSTSLS